MGAEVVDSRHSREMSIDREKILRQLAHVHNQVAEGDRSVARHRQAVAELERNGHDASLARKMLAYAEHVQKMNLAERQRLEQILGEKIDEREKIEG
jgi:hypothetical protein